jgi:hypothetical protein
MERAQRWLDLTHPSRGKVLAWTRGAEYTRARNAAWTAWYGYALMPDRPPEIEALLVDSVLMLELLGAIGDRDTFAAAAAAAAREGPALRPDVILGPPAPPPADQEDSAGPADQPGREPAGARRERFPAGERVVDALARGEQDRDERIDPWLMEGVTIIRQARAVVQAFFDQKLSDPRPVTYYLTSVNAPDPDGLVGFEGVEQAAPWRVTQQELDADSQLAEALSQIGFNRAVDTLPDALSRADYQIATWNTRLYGRLRESRVGSVGGQPVRLMERTRGDAER